MPKRLVTAVEIQTLKERGETKIDLAPDDLVTPQAMDFAKELGIVLLRRAALVDDSSGGDGATAPVKRDQRPPLARGTKVRLVPANQVRMEPFPFDVKRPDMNIRAADVITDRDGSPMGAGFMSLEQGSFPWTLNYDEIEYVIEGELEIRVGDDSYVGHPGDVIFIPRGTSILFCTRSYARFLYVTFPANWTTQ